MKDDLKEILLTEEDIQNICKDLGEQLTKDYKDKPLVCVGILKGSVMFMADLIKRIDTHLAIDFMDVSSYHGGTESTGEVSNLVLIIEDILETGTTLKSITELLQSRKVNSILKLLHYWINQIVVRLILKLNMLVRKFLNLL